jgi:hypothetical protein
MATCKRLVSSSLFKLAWSVQNAGAHHNIDAVEQPAYSSVQRWQHTSTSEEAKPDKRKGLALGCYSDQSRTASTLGGAVKHKPDFCGSADFCEKAMKRKPDLCGAADSCGGAVERKPGFCGVADSCGGASKRMPDFCPAAQPMPAPQQSRLCEARKRRRLMPTPTAGPAFEAEQRKKRQWHAGVAHMPLCTLNTSRPLPGPSGPCFHSGSLGMHHSKLFVHNLCCL